MPLLGLWINVAMPSSRKSCWWPHRATYDMKLVARPNSGIVEVSGRMVLETVGIDWEVKQRIAQVPAQRQRGVQHRSELLTSYETKDGLGFAVQRPQHPGR